MSVDGKIMIRIALLIILSASLNSAYEQKFWTVNTNVTIGSRYWDTLVTIGKFSFNGSMTNAYALPSVLSSSSESCELLYPLDTLSPDMIDQSNQTIEGSCVDEELLTKMDRVFWTDPRNWKRIFTNENQAVPHIEQIPCDFDLVHISNTTSTFIILPPKPVTVTTFVFGGRIIYPEFDFYKPWDDEYFTRHFIVKSSLSLRNMFNFSFNGCMEQTGCECGTSAYQDEICAFVENSCTKEWSCEEPFKPRGHCCSICAAVLLVFFDENTFVYGKLHPIVEKFIEKQTAEMSLNISWYMSKVSRSMVQIIVVPEEEYSVEILDMVNGLSIYLDNTSNLGIRLSWVKDSGKPIGDLRSWSSGIKIFIGLAVLLIGGIFLAHANKSEFFKDTLPFFKGLNHKQPMENENVLDISPTTMTEIEINNTENEKVVEIEPSTQYEKNANLIDTSG